MPNFAGWDVDYFGDAAIALDLPIHLTHFTPGTLRAMLEREGFRPVSVATPARPNWIRKAAKRGERGPKRGLTRALAVSAALCRVVAKLNESRGRGNEIIAVAEKRPEAAPPPSPSPANPTPAGAPPRGDST